MLTARQNHFADEVVAAEIKAAAPLVATVVVDVISNICALYYLALSLVEVAN